MARTIEPRGVVVEAMAACSYPNCTERRSYGSDAQSPDAVESIAQSFPAWLVKAGWRWKADGRGGWDLLCPLHVMAVETAERGDG